MTISKRYFDTIENLKKSGNYRVLYKENSDNLLDLCSNDYLGLNRDESLYNDFLNTLSSKKYKFSSCSSRLLSGSFEEHKEIEELIADSYQSEACLLYNSGYHANMGILPAIAGKKDLIVADKLVHASIIDGLRLSEANVIRFKHLDYTHLENILIKNRNDYENVFIVSESIFSMDGDVASIEQLLELKQKYKSYLYIDEAHSVGVRGRTGLGCIEESGLLNKIDFIVGTFGKALASVGAFVVCNRVFKDYLVNHSRTLIFTTALPPINVAWTKYIFEKLPDFHIKRENLKNVSTQFSELLNQKPQSHIIPFIIGENEAAIAESQKLKQHGFNVLPIRYPTVPKGTARLRFSLNADMEIDQLRPLKEILQAHD